MTPYERGYAAGQEEMRRRAAEVCENIGRESKSEHGRMFDQGHEWAAELCENRILSLPIAGEATNPGEQDFIRAIKRLNDGGPYDLTDSPKSYIATVQRLLAELEERQASASPGPCVSVPLPDFDSLANIASPSPCTAVDGCCVECGASLPLDGSCWKLAAVKERKDSNA